MRANGFAERDQGRSKILMSSGRNGGVEGAARARSLGGIYLKVLVIQYNSREL